jgi:hypothetical protein
MKKLAVFLGLAVACLLAGCLEPPRGGKASDTGVIYRHHFIGSTAIGQSTNATKLKEVLGRESTKKMGAELAKKLARAPREYWKKQLPGKAKDGAEFIEPLLADLFASESYIEARGSVAQPECVIAVQLSDDRAKVWDKNLKELVAAWQLGKPADAAVQGFKGWEIKRGEFPNKLQFLRAGKWVVVGFGSEQLPLANEALQTAAKTGAPTKAFATGALLECEADLPRITPGVPALAGRRLPPTRFTVLGRSEFIRTEAQFQYSQPLNWKFEPWKIPTNIISEGIVSFTAAQGIAPVLKNIEGVTELGLKTLPSQICTWAVGGAQGHVFATIPVDDATNTIQRLAPTLPRFILKRFPNVRGEFAWASNRAELIWQGIPFIVPHLRPIKNQGNDYLFFGMMPRLQTSNPPPAELFAQLGSRKDLAYYDWEITGERATQVRQMYQLAHIINKRRVPDPEFASEAWLQDLREVLGPTITEINVKSQNELSLVRRSHIGFTGLELATFSLWLQSPSFPLGFEPRPPLNTTHPAAKASSNAPPSGPVKK